MINIKHIVSAVPKNFLSEDTIINSVGKDSYKKIKNYTGFDKIHRLESHQSSEILINYTLEKFFEFSKINPQIIDSIIFASHSRPSEMPIYAATLQSRYGLRNNIFCYDLPNGCTGFTNGLIQSYSLINSKIAKNVLLVCADIHSKIVDEKNKNLLPVIADGCSCIFIEKQEKNIFHYDFGVDGLSNKSLQITTSNNQKKLEMDGIKVFEFAIKRVPKSLNEVSKTSKIKIKDIDLISLHQPNKSIHDHLIKLLNIDEKKTISCFQFGNTSCPSIPISISSNFGDKMINNKKVLFCGFGAGFLWSTVITKLNNTLVSKVYFV